MQRNVQIPYELFIELIRFHLFDLYEGEKKIRTGLEQKLKAMSDRQLYSKYKPQNLKVKEKRRGSSTSTAGESRRSTVGDPSLTDTDRDVTRPC